MATKNLNIALVIDAVGNAAREVKKIKKELDGASKKVTGLRDKFREAAAAIKGTASKMKAQFMGGMKILGGVGILGKITEDYETGLAKISTLTEMDLNGVEKKWGDSFKNIAKETGEGINTITEGAYQALSASVKQKDLAKFIGIATKTAVGGFTDVKTAVDGISSVMNSWGGDAQQIADIFLNTQNLGKTTVGEIANSIGKIAPMASKLGVKFEEVSAAIATMTATGSKTPEALTAVRATIVGFAKSTDKQKKALAKLKLSKQFTLDNIASKGYAETLKMLMDRIKATTKTKQEMANMAQAIFGRVEGLNALLGLTSEKGLKKYNEAMGVNAKKTDAVNKAFKKMDQARSFKKMKVQLQLLAIQIGQVLLPVIRKLIGGIAPIVKWFQKFSEKHPVLIKRVGQLAIALGLLKVAIGGLGFALSAIMAHPIIFFLGGLALAIASISGEFKQLNSVVDDLLHPMFSWLEKRAAAIRDTFLGLYKIVKKMGTLVFGSSHQNLADNIKDRMKDIGEGVAGDVSPIGATVTTQRKAVSTMQKSIIKKTKNVKSVSNTDMNMIGDQAIRPESSVVINDNGTVTVHNVINISGTNATPAQIQKSVAKGSVDQVKSAEAMDKKVKRAKKRAGRD